jgi:hypothetical protein
MCWRKKKILEKVVILIIMTTFLPITNKMKKVPTIPAHKTEKDTLM